jgi:cytoskeleton protein RodZ
MPEQNSNFAFGRYLEAKREEAGLDQEYISKETRISLEMLEAIESENHVKLPEAVYVKGFIRAYAKVLGIDEDGLIKNYVETSRTYKDITRSKAEFNKKRAGFWHRFMLGALVMAAIIAFAALGVSFYQGHFRSDSVELVNPNEKMLSLQDDNLSTTIKISESSNRISGEIDFLTEKNADETELAVTEQQSALLNLSITANAVTWLKVIMDGEKPLEYSLQPGDKIVLNAHSNYNLLIGNAGGIQMNLNGQPVQIPGRMGQVVNVTLP